MTATDQGPRTTDKGQKTKRKYTVSDKVRAANRINMAKALSVDKKIRYRLTDKRLAANRASLVKARYVRDRLRAVDLRKSAVQVGETQEEYDRHMELVEQVLPAESERQRNGVLGLAQALWRRRRVFGNRAQRELFSFYLELENAAGEGLSLNSVQDLRCETCYVFLEGEHPRVEERMERLDQRLVRVTEAYLTELAEKLVELAVLVGKRHYRADLLGQPPEVIGNGLVRRREVVRRMTEGGHRSGSHTTSLLAWLRQQTDTKSNLLKVFVEAGNRLPDPRRDEDFALHLRLIEAAFFGDRDARFGLAGSAGVPPAGVGQRDPGQAGETPALPGLDYRVARVKRLQPELYQAVRNLAEATWARLQVFARQAEKEAKDLRRKLERAARGTLGPGKKSLRWLWQEAFDRRVAQLPPNPILEVLWAKFLIALKKAKAERRKAEAKRQKSEARSQKADAAGFGTRDSGFGEQAEAAESKTENLEFKNAEPRTTNPDSGQSSITDQQSPNPVGGPSEPAESEIKNPKSKIDEPRNPKPEPQVPDPGPGQSSIDNHQSAILGLQWKVERLIGVFLCSWTYPAFKAAEECNRRVEKAFRTLEGAVEAALARRGRLKRGKGKKGKRGKGKKGKGRTGESDHRAIGSLSH